MKRSVRKIALILISGYQWLISPWITPSCRFQPSCSEYSRQVFLRFDALKASFLTIKRLIRCNPFGGYGLDLPPSNERNGAIQGG